MRGSFVVARGCVGGALLLLGAVLVTFAIAAFFEYRAEAHNDHAGTPGASAWKAPTERPY